VGRLCIALFLLGIGCADTHDLCPESPPETVEVEVMSVRHTPAFLYGDCYTSSGAWLATAAANADSAEIETGESGTTWVAVEGAELNGLRFSCEMGIQARDD